MPEIRIKHEVSVNTSIISSDAIRYSLNGFDIWVYCQKEPKIYVYHNIDSDRTLMVSEDKELVTFTEMLPDAKPGELHIDTSNANIMDFLKITQCI